MWRKNNFQKSRVFNGVNFSSLKGFGGLGLAYMLPL